MNKKFLMILILIIGCLFSYGQPEKKLAEAFIQSVAKNNFQLLNPYIFNASAAKNIFGKEFNQMTPAKKIEAIKKNKSTLESKWLTVVSNAKSNKIDFSKLQIKQVLSGPIKGADLLHSLLVTYQYNGVEWDDLFFIVNKQGVSKFIIDLPSNTDMFTLDEGRREGNLKDFQLIKDKSDPQIKQKLKSAVDELKKLAMLNDTIKLFGHLVYTGEDDNTNRWKRILDPSKPEDVESAKKMMTKLMSGLTQCDKINYQDVRIEKESEGIWYVITATCGNKKNNYAFLKINNSFLLGDID